MPGKLAFISIFQILQLKLIKIRIKNTVQKTKNRIFQIRRSRKIQDLSQPLFQFVVSLAIEK